MEEIRKILKEQKSKNKMSFNWGSSSNMHNAINHDVMIDEILKLNNEDIEKFVCDKASYYEDLKDDNFGTLKGREYESLYIFYDDIKDMF